jgi:hypothetical protein
MCGLQARILRAKWATALIRLQAWRPVRSQLSYGKTINCTISFRYMENRSIYPDRLGASLRKIEAKGYALHRRRGADDLHGDTGRSHQRWVLL